MVNISPELLKWYDANARVMPWRVAPNDDAIPDPYHIWLSEVMLQQTTVAAVKDYFVKFTTRWPRVQDLAAAQDSDVMAAWAGLGYYARARNLLKCARVVANEMRGVFPSTPAELEKLPGIGPYTAAAVAAIAFDQPAVVLDGNIERVMARVFAVKNPLPTSKEELRALAASQTPKKRGGDYAQAVMDLGATVCTPRSPSCEGCVIQKMCKGYALGIQAELPKKLPKPVKPVRVGVAYVAMRSDGAVLLERRPDKGLLGGMLGWPSNEWAVDQLDHTAPIDADWRTLNEQVRHTFTHFHLRLTVMVADVGDDAPSVGAFVAQTEFSASELPTVMRKVWDLAGLANRGNDRV